MPDTSEQASDKTTNVYLVGAGVVGTAILQAHLDAGVPVLFSDVSVNAISAVTDQLRECSFAAAPPLGGTLPTVHIAPPVSAIRKSSPAVPALSHRPRILIESIAERLDVKQQFFAAATEWFPDNTILCSNTSTLRIGDIARPQSAAERVIGMHFFMPVEHRPAVEIIRGPQTSSTVVRSATEHADRIAKSPIVVGDGPGFVVNRMLAPYLNQAMELATSGASAAQIEAAAIAYGMPMSPLELIDWIGTKTTIDAGRGYWSAFPSRMNPSPLVAGMFKKGRLGRNVGGGFYDYTDGDRSAELSPIAVQQCETYTRTTVDHTTEVISQRLALSMWTEAACLLRDGITDSLATIETAMAGGLGYTRPGQWLQYFSDQKFTDLRKAIEFEPLRVDETLIGLVDKHQDFAAVLRSLAN